MTVPKSKVLSVSKGIMALANLTHNSPNVKQNVIVKNYVTPVVKEPETKTRNAVIDGVEDPNVVIVEPTTNKDEKVSYGQSPGQQSCYNNPYESLPEERDLSSIEDIRNAYNQLNETIKEKENVAQALAIMLNLIENETMVHFRI